MYELGYFGPNINIINKYNRRPTIGSTSFVRECDATKVHRPRQDVYGVANLTRNENDCPASDVITERVPHILNDFS